MSLAATVTIADSRVRVTLFDPTARKVADTRELRCDTPTPAALDVTAELARRALRRLGIPIKSSLPDPPPGPYRWRVLVNTPDQSRAYTFTVEADSETDAKRKAAALAILADPRGDGMAADVSSEDRRSQAATPSRRTEVARYATATRVA